MSHQVEIRIASNAVNASKDVAAEFATALQANPKIVLGLATGGTPVGVYQHLVALYQAQKLSFRQCTTYNLDEYVGLGPDHHQSYRHFMQANLFDHIDIPTSQTFVPDGVVNPIEDSCADYESRIKSSGGIDLQLLGIGENGHIAFNEPGSDPKGRTSVVGLTDSTIAANARFFDSIDDVPREAVTMGIGTILESRRVVLMATGGNKAEAVARALDGQPDIDSPASFLTTRENVIFVLDKDAAAKVSDATIQSAIEID